MGLRVMAGGRRGWFADARVVLFAGSGAFGVEAPSRGACGGVFVEGSLA
jgi:16S rRNA G966 N2-methylase RsmD